MVRPGLHLHASKRLPKLRLSAAVVILTATMFALPTGALPASSSVGGSQGLSSRIRPWVESHDYDPAAAYFLSMLSFGAMSLITPTVFGDFQSPVVVSQAPQLSGVMPEGAGLDPAVSTMLNNIVQQEILPTAGALTVTEFGVGSNSDAASGSYGAESPAKGSDVMDNVPTTIGDMSGPMIARGAVDPICSEDEVAGKLETGGEFWNNSGAGLGGARFAPAQFPRGVFARPVMLGSPLHGLGPNGERSNLVAPGPAGGWCRPGRESIFTRSPIENDLLWIALSIVLGAQVGMWMSRGARLPAI